MRFTLYPLTMTFYGKQQIIGQLPTIIAILVIICLTGSVIAVACRPDMPESHLSDTPSDTINAIAQGASHPINENNLALIQGREHFDIATCNMSSIPETSNICRFSLAVPDILVLPDDEADLTGIEAAVTELANCDNEEDGILNLSAFVLVNVETGSAIAYNAGIPMYPASAVKAMFSYYVLTARAEEVTAEDRQLIENAILYSDNDSYYWLVSKYANDDAAAWFTDYGIDFSNYVEDNYPDCSAKSASCIWRDILVYIESDAPDGNWFGNLLAETSVSFTRDAATGNFGRAMFETGDIEVFEEEIPEAESNGIAVYNKAGWIVDWEVNALSDCGIIYDVDGTRYIFAFITDAPESRDTIQAFEKLIQEVWKMRVLLG